MATAHPRRRSRIWKIALGLIVVLVIVGYSLVSLLAYNALSLVAARTPEANPAEPFENVSFPSRGQNYLVYAFYLPGKPDSPALISVHGWKGSRYSEGSIRRANEMRSLGYTVLALDLSDASGQTVGNGRISMGYEERYDVLGAFDYLIERGFAPERIGLVGESLGGATVLLTAALEPRIRAVWADSPYARPDQVAGEQAESFGFPRLIVPGGMVWGMLITGNRWWEAAAVDQAQAIAANKTHIELVHCDQDNFVFYHHSQDIEAAYRAAGAEVSLWTVACKQHASAAVQEGAVYRERLDRFFKTHLAPS